ncbi:MAG: hypothetical protein JXL20_05075 [Deltaproteobacteria bacterium]|nr:hypothetical protein [Deltaproteobacteria bacterium]
MEPYQQPTDQLMAQWRTSPQGLASATVSERRRQYGPNELVENLLMAGMVLLFLPREGLKASGERGE